jgi:hypothetical protein
MRYRSSRSGKLVHQVLPGLLGEIVEKHQALGRLHLLDNLF